MWDTDCTESNMEFGEMRHTPSTKVALEVQFSAEKFCEIGRRLVFVC